MRILYIFLLISHLSFKYHLNICKIFTPDTRTFHLLRTVPQLDQCQVVFNKTGDVIFGVSLEQELEDETKYETSFRTFDTSNYSQIATIETRKSVLSLCPSPDDINLAVIEQVI